VVYKRRGSLEPVDIQKRIRTAFIAIVAILIIIIVVSCSAVIYLLREDSVHNDPRARRQQYTRSTAPFGSVRDWFARTMRISGPSQGAESTRPNKSRSAMGPGEGWMHARSTSDWDLDAAGGDTRHPQHPISPPSMRMTDRASVVSPRSSNSGGSSPGSSGHYAPMRGHSSGGHSSLSHHAVTIESQLSPPPIRRVASQEAIVSTTDPYTHFSDHDSTENVSITNPFAETTSQTTSTFNSGSKFIEAL
jgi:uncharacterized membrane protein YgcG